MRKLMGCRCIFGIKNHLGQTVTIPQIDKNNPAVITPVLNPAGQGYFFTDIFSP